MSLNPKDIPSTSTSESPSSPSSSNKSPSSVPSPRSLAGLFGAAKSALSPTITSMKKAAKSGNKKQQKETKEEIDRLEKEMETRHKEESKITGNEFLMTSISGPPPSQTGDRGEAFTDEEDVDDGEEEEGGLVNKVYKKLNISTKTKKKQQKKEEEAQRRRAAELDDQEKKMRQDSQKHLEKEHVKKMLQADQLKMIDVAADGDCMYNALSHQLQEEGIEISSKKLRKACAQYMRDHRDELEPFIADTDVETPPPTSSSKKNVPADDASKWERYLFGVENTADCGGAWGGELELKVVSEMYKKLIMVYCVNPARFQIGEQFSSPDDRPLRIVYLRYAYHLGEHYNSVAYA